MRSLPIFLLLTVGCTQAPEDPIEVLKLVNESATTTDKLGD